MPEIPELRDLAGAQLSAICFVRDYVELHFDGTILRSLSEPVVVTPAGRWTLPQEGSRDALCQLIGHVVETATEQPDRLALSFDTDTVVEIPKASRHAGPEIAQLVPSRGGWLDTAATITWENLLPTTVVEDPP
jgi:hypothetical protein